MTTEGYDAAGRLITTTDPLQGTTQNQYDPVGNTVAITSPGTAQIEVLGTIKRTTSSQRPARGRWAAQGR